MLPQINFPIRLNRSDIASVYTLGVFSGAATSCCAPVLAGVLVLAALSTDFIQSLLVGVMYVAGMVFPLFLIALAWDRYDGASRNPIPGRMIHLSFFGRKSHVHSSKLIAGCMFITMGIATVILGIMGTMLPTPGSAVIGVVQAQLADYLVRLFSDAVSSEIIALLIGSIALAGTLLIARERIRRTQSMRSANRAED